MRRSPKSLSRRVSLHEHAEIAAEVTRHLADIEPEDPKDLVN
jgi:hypothetical protein